MKSWTAPSAASPLPFSAHPVRLASTSYPGLRKVSPRAGEAARVYACGITPYDATHMGHAATYVLTDTCIRALRDTGLPVHYTQNITDVDDPLLERAARDGVDWTQLATSEIDLFREDMEALRVLPPDHYLGVVESMGSIIDAVQRLFASGIAYQVAAPDAPGHDLYLDLAQCRPDNPVSGWTPAQRLEVFAERGGDPDRQGKRHPLDPLLWRAERPGEPAWDGGQLGSGRPGWHIECTAIALDTLGMGFDVQTGGSDLIYPHHDMSAVQASALQKSDTPYAHAYLHQGMVQWQGAKMSKSRGNLVLVSQLRRDGVDPRAIRLALLRHHYPHDWEWTDQVLHDAQQTIGRWDDAVGNPAPFLGDVVPALVDEVRAAVAEDLNTPAALDLIDQWSHRPHSTETAAVAAVIDHLLGLQVGSSHRTS